MKFVEFVFPKTQKCTFKLFIYLSVPSVDTRTFEGDSGIEPNLVGAFNIHGQNFLGKFSVII